MCVFQLGLSDGVVAGEEVGDGIEHERHTSTDVQDEQEIKERQRQETQDQQEGKL